MELFPVPMAAEAGNGTIQAARAAFPRGLAQPEGAFRCSVDALLLAAFGLETLVRAGVSAARFADLGTGCGVVGLAVLLHGGDGLRGYGLDTEPELLDAARENAIRLGLAGCFALARADVATLPERAGEAIAPAALVLANPPWRLARAGRVPVAPLRRKALFGEPETLAAFARAAACLLAPGGSYVAVVGAASAIAQEAALMAAGLHLRRVRPVRARAETPVRFVLLEARAAPGACLREAAWTLAAFPPWVLSGRTAGCF